MTRVTDFYDTFSNLMKYMATVHTAGDEDEEFSVIAGGYVVVSTKDMTTIKSQENPEGVTFPRGAIELLVEVLKSHIPSDEEDDDFDEAEAEERLP